MKRFKDILKSGLFALMSGEIASQLISVASSPMLTRVFSPSEFGVLGIFVSILGIFGSFVSGRYEYAILLPKNSRRVFSIVILSLFINLFFSFLSFFVIVLFYPKISQVLNLGSIGRFIFILPFAVFFLGLFNLLNQLFVRMGKYHVISVSKICQSIVYCSGAIFCGFWLPQFSSIGLVFGQFIGRVFSTFPFLVAIFYSKNRSYLFHGKRQLLAVARYYKDFPLYNMPHALINTIASNLPVILLALFFNESIVGNYSFSFRILVMPMMLISKSFGQVFNHKISKRHSEGLPLHDLVKTTVYRLLSIGILPLLLGFIFAPSIFAFAFGGAWREAGIYARIISPWLFVVYISSAISYVPIMLGLQKKALFFEIIYSTLRLSAIFIGGICLSAPNTLMLYSFVGTVFGCGYVFWILRITSRRKYC